MRKAGFIAAVLGCMASFAVLADDEATAPQPRVDETPADSALPESAYAERWQPDRFLPHAELRSGHPGGRFQATPYIPIDNAPYAQADRLFLVDGLKAIVERKRITLWKGRETSLVVGVLDSGYFGVSLEAAEPDDE